MSVASSLLACFVFDPLVSASACIDEVVVAHVHVSHVSRTGGWNHVVFHLPETGRNRHRPVAHFVCMCAVTCFDAWCIAYAYAFYNMRRGVVGTHTESPSDQVGTDTDLPAKSIRRSICLDLGDRLGGVMKGEN